MFTPLVYGVGPTWLQRRILEVFPHRGVRKMKKIIDLMEERATMIYKAKKAALLQGDEAVVPVKNTHLMNASGSWNTS